MAAIMRGLTDFLTGLSGANAILLGLLLGAMVAVDTGCPVNKAAYAFAVGPRGANALTPMAAGMTPPLGLALAAVVASSRFTLQEREAGTAAAVLGLSFITEGAIPFAAKDPLRVIPSIVSGSAVAGAWAAPRRAGGASRTSLGGRRPSGALGKPVQRGQVLGAQDD